MFPLNNRCNSSSALLIPHILIARERGGVTPRLRRVERSNGPAAQPPDEEEYHRGAKGGETQSGPPSLGGYRSTGSAGLFSPFSPDFRGLLLLQIVLPPLKYPLLFNIQPPLKQIPPFFQFEKLPAVPCQLLQPPALLIAIQLPVAPFPLLNLIFPLFLARFPPLNPIV